MIDFKDVFTVRALNVFKFMPAVLAAGLLLSACAQGAPGATADSTTVSATVSTSTLPTSTTASTTEPSSSTTMLSSGAGLPSVCPVAERPPVTPPGKSFTAPDQEIDRSSLVSANEAMANAINDGPMSISFVQGSTLSCSLEMLVDGDKAVQLVWVVAITDVPEYPVGPVHVSGVTYETLPTPKPGVMEYFMDAKTGDYISAEQYNGS